MSVFLAEPYGPGLKTPLRKTNDIFFRCFLAPFSTQNLDIISAGFGGGSAIPQSTGGAGPPAPPLIFIFTPCYKAVRYLRINFCDVDVTFLHSKTTTSCKILISHLPHCKTSLVFDDVGLMSQFCVVQNLWGHLGWAPRPIAIASRMGTRCPYRRLEPQAVHGRTF